MEDELGATLCLDGIPTIARKKAIADEGAQAHERRLAGVVGADENGDRLQRKLLGLSKALEVSKRDRLEHMTDSGFGKCTLTEGCSRISRQRVRGYFMCAARRL